MATVIRARVTCYSNGTVEMGWSRQPEEAPLPTQRLPNPGTPPAPGVCMSDDIPEGYADGSLERAGRRAKSIVRKVCQEHGFDYLVTLTTRANQDDYDVALAMLRYFLRVVRKTHPGYKCLAVPERQSRGAWHWHLAVQGWQPLYLLRHAWGATCDHYLHGGGNVDVQAPPRKTTAAKWATSRLSHYLTKYISKAMEEEREGLKGRHRYVAPLGLKTWVEFNAELPGDSSTYDILCAFSDFIGERCIDVLWAPNDRPDIGWCRTG